MIKYIFKAATDVGLLLFFLKRLRRIFIKIAYKVEKYTVPVLFLLCYTFQYFTYSKWYADLYVDIECLTTGSVFTTFYFVCAGIVFKKCNWYKWAAFGLFTSSIYNWIDYHFQIDSYMLLFSLMFNTLILGAFFHSILKEFNDRN